MKRKEISIIIIIILAISSAFASGFILAQISKEKENKESWLTIIDGSGREVKLKKPPERIISVASSATETLFAIGAGDKVVGRDKYSDYPEEVKNLPDVGSGSSLNIEKVIGLDPDLVFLWWYNKEAIANLENKGITVVAINPKSVDDVTDTIKLIGMCVDRREDSENLVSFMHKQIDRIRAKFLESNTTKMPLVYYELTTPMKTCGRGTFTNELIFLAGGINIAAGESIRYPILSSEYIIDKNPDVIVIVSDGSSIEEVKKRDGWSEINAVKNNRIYTIDTNLVTCNPRIVQGLEQFARWFHPEIFEGDL